MAEKVEELHNWQQQKVTLNEQLASLRTYIEVEIKAAYINLV